MYITEIIGKEVLDKNAAAIGKVADVNIDFPGWQVVYITVKMGVFNKFNIGVEKIDKIAAKVTLNVAKDELISVVV
jgi:sporulation protein YlmC with PRC-barrel domain